jgi:hypothetical protein
MRRVAVALLLTVPFLLAVPRAALASKPTHQKIPVDETIPDFVDCAFPVEIHIRGIENLIIWTAADGTVRQFAGFATGRATLTNLDTGTSRSFDVSGPGHFTFGPNGEFRLMGTGAWISFLEDPPGITRSVGRFVIAVDAAGNETFTKSGPTFDLCAAVAG